MFFDSLSNELKRTAYSLEEFGVYEYAWNYEEVKKVIVYLAEQKYGILGGDVWKKEGNSFLSTYDGWYLNYGTLSWEEYIEKSKDKALTYIDFYYNRNGDEYYYVPVASLTKVGKP